MQNNATKSKKVFTVNLVASGFSRDGSKLATIRQVAGLGEEVFTMIQLYEYTKGDWEPLTEEAVVPSMYRKFTVAITNDATNVILNCDKSVVLIYSRSGKKLIPKQKENIAKNEKGIINYVSTKDEDLLLGYTYNGYQFLRKLSWNGEIYKTEVLMEDQLTDIGKKYQLIKACDKSDRIVVKYSNIIDSERIGSTVELLEKGKTIFKTKIDSPLVDVAVSPVGNVLAISTNKGITAYVINPTTGARNIHFLDFEWEPEDTFVNTITLSPCGGYLLNQINASPDTWFTTKLYRVSIDGLEQIEGFVSEDSNTSTNSIRYNTYGNLEIDMIDDEVGLVTHLVRI